MVYKYDLMILLFDTRLLFNNRELSPYILVQIAAIVFFNFTK